MLNLDRRAFPFPRDFLPKDQASVAWLYPEAPWQWTAHSWQQQHHLKLLRQICLSQFRLERLPNSSSAETTGIKTSTTGQWMQTTALLRSTTSIRARILERFRRHRKQKGRRATVNQPMKDRPQIPWCGKILIRPSLNARLPSCSSAEVSTDCGNRHCAQSGSASSGSPCSSSLPG